MGELRGEYDEIVMPTHYAIDNPRGSIVGTFKDGMSVKIFFFSFSLSLSLLSQCKI